MQAARFVRGLRGLDLAKPPGVAETIDWAQALAALGREELDAEIVEQTLGLGAEVPRGPGDRPRRRARHARRGGAGCRAEPLVRQVVTFGRVLREAGLEVGPGRISDAMTGLDAVDLDRRDDVYWTLRQTLVSRADDIDAFDRAFAAWFLRAPRARAAENAARSSGCGRRRSSPRRAEEAAARRRATTARPGGAPRSCSARRTSPS